MNLLENNKNKVMLILSSIDITYNIKTKNRPTINLIHQCYRSQNCTNCTYKKPLHTTKPQYFPIQTKTTPSTPFIQNIKLQNKKFINKNLPQSIICT